MKRILAIIMVLAMVFAFAACKPKDDGKDTTAPGVSGDAVTNDNNESVPVDASEADSTDVSTDAAEVSTDALRPATRRVLTPPTLKQSLISTTRLLRLP